MKKIIILIGILLMAGTASAESTSYIYANGQRVVKVNETGVFYYHSDNVGSTSAITDKDGKVVEEQVNLPFGEPVSGDEKYGFTGKERDETGLHYSIARYLDSSTGRFWNPDPIKDGVNWFVYVNNNPLRYVDPDGMMPRTYLPSEKRRFFYGVIDDLISFYPWVKPSIYDPKNHVHVSDNANLLAWMIFDFKHNPIERDRYKKYAESKSDLGGLFTHLYRSDDGGDESSLSLIYYNKNADEGAIAHEVLHYVVLQKYINPHRYFLDNKNLWEGLTCYLNIKFLKPKLGNDFNEVREPSTQLDSDDIQTGEKILTAMTVSSAESKKFWLMISITDEEDYMQENLLKVKPPEKTEFVKQVKAKHPGLYKEHGDLLNGFHQTWRDTWNKAHRKN